MEQQRPLRLGDLVDDYCPKERRITNHAIVAIVEDTIRQTRCTACEADHVYKGGKAPARRKPKEQTAVLYEQVLTNITSGHAPAAAPEPDPPIPVLAAVAETREPAPVLVVESAAVAVVIEEQSQTPAPEPEAEPAAATVIDEGWSLNRRLIRASLPRVEGQSPVPRAIPEFTMHQRNVRGSQQFRGGYGNGSGNGWQDRHSGNANSNGHRGGFRPDGPGDGQPGAPNGQRPPGGRRRRRHKSHRPPQN